MTLDAATYVTLFAPLLGCIAIALAGMRLPARAAGLLACAAILASFLGALGMVAALGEEGTLITQWRWVTAGSFDIGLSWYADELSAWMALVVTGVGFLIHVYSLGYIQRDAQARRFFAYLNLFVWSMLTLVLAGNLVLLLVGWGLVGKASYLLIGFWHARPSAVGAAKKAFIVNAIGDVSLMIAVFLVFAQTGVLDYPSMFDQLPAAVGAGTGMAFLVCMLLLGGALAKSAQLPLHTWLPDAMEGPTPVSALIHAATMVTAGVYLVSRMWPVFDLSQAAQLTTAFIGATTLLVAGFIALAQTDIKRVIAYSTMSQIGYMFVAAGIGAYSAAMFHLMTHAFFKALLFLGAGIVIHALADEQDIRKMGGLKRHLPRTYWLMLAASLALAGVIPFAGFFSKDEIIAFTVASADDSVYGATGWLLYVMLMLGVLMTGVYAFRLLFLVFHGEEGPATRALATGSAVEPPPHAAGDLGVAHHDPSPPADAAHTHHHGTGEAPGTMFWPVALLGMLTLVGGWIAIPGLWNLPEDFLQHAVPDRHDLHEAHLGAAAAWGFAALSLVVAAIGIGIAWQVWHSGAWASWRTRWPGLERSSQSALGFDRAYDATIAGPMRGLSAGAVVTEREATVPFVAWVAHAVGSGGRVLSGVQSGLVRFYAFATALSVLAILLAVLWLR